MCFGGRGIMYNYNTIIQEFLQYKKFLGYTYRSDEIILKEIANYLISNNIEIITKEVVENYARINPNLSANTIARNMSTFKELCNYLKINDIPCYQIPKKLYPQNSQSYNSYVFSRDEIKRIYSNLNFVNCEYRYPYYKKIIYPLIIKILYQTGMRIGEVLNLTYSDYLEESYFILKKTKNNEERRVILPKKLNNEFKTFFNKFKNCNNPNDKIFVCSISTIEKYFYKVLKLSNIKKRNNSPRLHDLRHTFITHSIQTFINNGEDLNNMLPILQAYVGHNSINSTSYYFHITNDILNELRNLSEKELSYLIPKISGDSYE